MELQKVVITRHSEEHLSELMVQYIEERDGIPWLSIVVNHLGNEDAWRPRKELILENEQVCVTIRQRRRGLCMDHRFSV